MANDKPPSRKSASHKLPLTMLTTADCDAMAQLHQSSFPRGWSAQDLRNLLSRPSAQAFGLAPLRPPGPEGSFTQKCLIGFCLADRIEDEAEIVTFAVHPDHREQGLGSLLLSLFLEKMQNLGVRLVNLEVAADNAAAIALYEANDFRISGRRNLYYERAGTYVDALLMQRRFSGF